MADEKTNATNGGANQPEPGPSGESPQTNGKPNGAPGDGKDDKNGAGSGGTGSTDDKETPAQRDAKILADMQDFADKLAAQVIEALKSDISVKFLDPDYDDEAHGADLGGAYDPIVDEKTGARVSDRIAEKSAKLKRPERALRVYYDQALKDKFEKEKFTPTELVGKKFKKKFLVNAHGVWTKLDAVGAEHFVWRRISHTQFEPAALSRDITPQRNWRTRYLITDETGQFPDDVGKELLGGNVNLALKQLRKRGVRFVETKEAGKALAEFLRIQPPARILRVPQTGWFETQNGNWVFVLPTETLGKTGKVDIVLDGVTIARNSAGEVLGHGLHRSGTSTQWREQVAKPLAGNSNVTLAVGTNLAGPLFCWADEAGGGFHQFSKNSKIGKTLVAAVGQSVWGKPYKPGAGPDTYGFTWKSTAARLGQRALQRNDLSLCLDEIGVGDEKTIASAVYQLASGQEKGRYGEAEQVFNTMVWSTGEKSLAEFLPKASAGQLVRLADIPAEVRPGSALETIAMEEIAAAGARYYPITNEQHGCAGYEWLKYLVTLGPEQIKAELKRLRDEWWQLPQVKDIAERANQQVYSVIGRFALAAAALRMAITAGILPWTETDTDAGVVACMERWINQRDGGNTDADKELSNELLARRRTVAATAADRFIHLAVDDRRRVVPASEADQSKIDAGPKKLDGYIKTSVEGKQILVWPDAWRRFMADLDIDAVNRRLIDAELLIPDPSGSAARSEKIAGKTARFYVLAAAFIDDVTP